MHTNVGASGVTEALLVSLKSPDAEAGSRVAHNLQKGRYEKCSWNRCDNH